MELIIPSDFLVLSLFETLIKYEDKRSIKIDDIYAYLNLYKDTLQNNYKEGYIPEEYVDKEITFKLEEFNIGDLLTNYKNMFHIYEDKLYINKALQHESLNEFIRNKAADEKISLFFTAPLDPEVNKEIFEFFHINSIECLIRTFLKSEKELEELYNRLHYSHSNELYYNIKKHLIYRFTFINYIKTMPIYKVEAFDRISNMISNEEENYEYEVSPINMELWNKRKKNKIDALDFGNDIESRIYDIDQYAIFSKKTFADLRINKILDEIHFNAFTDMINEEEQEELDEIYSDIEEDIEYVYTGDLAFNILYLKKLRLYIEKHGLNKDLLDTYNRLLYATDSPEFCLFIDKYITKEFKDLNEIGWDDSDLLYIKDEARFLSYEIFTEKPNQYTLKKLLFISTYYDLTQDKKIIKNISRHKKNQKYNDYTKIIFEDNENTLKLKK